MRKLPRIQPHKRQAFRARAVALNCNLDGGSDAGIFGRDTSGRAEPAHDNKVGVCRRSDFGIIGANTGRRGEQECPYRYPKLAQPLSLISDEPVSDFVGSA